ncbi:DDX4 family protein [Megaselia abdita]
MADDWEVDNSEAGGSNFASNDKFDFDENANQTSGFEGEDGGTRKYEGRGGNRGRGRGGSNGYRRNDDGDDNGGGGGGYRRNRDGEDGGGFGGRGRGRGGGGGGRGGYKNRGGDRENNEEGGFDNNNREEDGEDGEEPRKKAELYIPPEPTENEEEMYGSGISSGINFEKYEKIPVKVTGENIPAPIKDFESSGLRDLILANVKKSGYTVPTPIQKNSIPVIKEKRDLMACAQTGSGKTAAFLLPIISNLMEDNFESTVGSPHAVVISPTRELAIQIFNEARKFAHGSCIKICIVYGGTGTKHQSDNVLKGCNILIATPGRLNDFVSRDYIRFDDCRYVVLDEADRMLDMGFLPEVEKVMDNPTMRDRADRQTLMFSATFPEEIQNLAGKFLKDYVFLTVGIVGGACTDVEQNFYEVSKFKKRSKLIEVLEENGAVGTMVFVDTKRNADFLASILSETKFPTTSIHGDRMQREREQALADFKSGAMQVLIATSVAARGLDIKNVAHVINYDLPSSIDEYVHRIGRTGRVGNRGKATSFFDPENNQAVINDLVKILTQAGQPIPEFFTATGGGSSSSNAFGGSDIRNNGQPQALEAEEEW